MPNKLTDKPWFNHYPKGVPQEINPDQYASLVELFETSCRRFLGLPAFINMGKTMTYIELEQASRHFAAYLQKDLNLKKGDRIALQMPNCLQYPVALFGALRAGLIVVNTNPLYTPREMLHQFKDSGAKAIVIMANFGSKLAEILPQTTIEHVVVTELGDLLGFPKASIVNFVVRYVKKMVPAFSLPTAVPMVEALRRGSKKSFDKVSVVGDDIAFLQYTGGTTGVSKGAMLTHRNMVANMEQISSWIGVKLETGKEVVVTPLPLYHIFALSANLLTFIKEGGANLLITNPRDIPVFVKELSKHPFTVMTAVNTLFNALLNHPKFAGLNFKDLKCAVGGGMAVQSVVADRWKKVTGSPLVEGYGLTESSPLLTCNPLDGTEKAGTIGLPVASTDIKIMSDEGKEVPQGQPGELWASGPQIMKGYWQRPDETAKVIEGGWLKTGDIAVMTPEGFFKIVDRKKDMILVSGFNVYPNEIEDVVAHHPGILEVAAVGVPDEKSGEAVKLFVVKKDAALSEDDVKKYCRENLTAYKCPKFIEFKSELPKSNVGKILRRELRSPNKALSIS